MGIGPVGTILGVAVMAIRNLRSRQRAGACALAAGLLAASVSLPAAPAQAVDVSPTPAPTVSAKGKSVYDIAVLPTGRVILGGEFTALGSFARSNLGAVRANGRADPAFAPTTNGPVHAIAASADGTRVFIGGRFTEVNGVPRHNLAAIDAATGALISGWEADTAGAVPTVTALAVHGNDLVVGGRFDSIDGAEKEKLARVNATTGNLVTWNTWVNGGVLEIRVDPGGTEMWIGGEFTRIRGVSRPYFGGMDIATGLPTDYAPTGNTSRVMALVVSADGEWVYTTNNNNQTFGFQPALSPAPRWKRKTDGNVQAMAIWRSSLYLGGHFTKFRDTGQRRLFFASVGRFGGATKAWNPRARGTNRGCWAMAVAGSRLHAGGGFTHFRRAAHPLYARFDGSAQE